MIGRRGDKGSGFGRGSGQYWLPDYAFKHISSSRKAGDEVIRGCGGLPEIHNMEMGPILTDSGGFQVFSLASLRHITEEGVTLLRIQTAKGFFMGPEESMTVQSNLSQRLLWRFDECVGKPCQYSYSKASCERTTRWLLRCKAKWQSLIRGPIP